MATQTLDLNFTQAVLIPAADFHLEVPGIRCSFCGLGKGQVARLFEGRSRYICNECIRVCTLLLADYKACAYLPPWHRIPWYLRWWRNDPYGGISCSFCGAERVKGEHLMVSRHTQICERCVRACESLGLENLSRA